MTGIFKKLWLRLIAAFFRPVQHLGQGRAVILSAAFPPPPPLVPNPLTKYPRNERCMCGSGRKFKVCHQPHLPGMVSPELAAQGRTVIEMLKGVPHA